MTSLSRRTKTRRLGLKDNPSTPQLSFIRTFGHKGSEDGQFGQPWGIAVSIDGTVVVSDYRNHTVQCFSPDGTFIRKWGGQGSKDGQFSYPKGISIGGCEGMKESIGMEMSKIPTLAAFPPGLLPICVAYAGEECIYVADCENNRIQRMKIDGQFLGKWGTFGLSWGCLWLPYWCWPDAQDDNMIYVVEARRIQIFHPDGTFVCEWMHRPPNSPIIGICVREMIFIIYRVGEGDDIACYHKDRTYSASWWLHYVSGRICLDLTVNDDTGMVYIADAGNNSILQCRADGTLVQTFNSTGNGEETFNEPSSLVVKAGILYVVDSGNNRVVMLHCT